MENLDVLAALQLAEQQGLRALVRFVAWRTEKHFRLLAARVDVARTPDNILPQHAWDYPGGVQTGATIASPLDLRGLIRTPLGKASSGRPAGLSEPELVDASWIAPGLVCSPFIAERGCWEGSCNGLTTPPARTHRLRPIDAPDEPRFPHGCFSPTAPYFRTYWEMAGEFQRPSKSALE
jgi:hypothetical protein